MCEDLWYFGKIFVYGSQLSFSPGVRKIKGLTSRFSESFIFKQTGSDKFREKRTGKSFREKGRFDECGGVEDIVET